MLSSFSAMDVLFSPMSVPACLVKQLVLSFVLGAGANLILSKYKMSKWSRSCQMLWVMRMNLRMDGM